jgi:hypothetical protein
MLKKTGKKAMNATSPPKSLYDQSREDGQADGVGGVI